MTTYKPKGKLRRTTGELIEIGPRGGKVEDGRRTVIERGERNPSHVGIGKRVQVQARIKDDSLGVIWRVWVGHDSQSCRNRAETNLDGLSRRGQQVVSSLDASCEGGHGERRA